MSTGDDGNDNDGGSDDDSGNDAEMTGCDSDIIMVVMTVLMIQPSKKSKIKVCTSKHLIRSDSMYVPPKFS